MEGNVAAAAKAEEERSCMTNDAHEAKRARWPGDFAFVNGGSSPPVPILINFNEVEIGAVQTTIVEKK